MPPVPRHFRADRNSPGPLAAPSESTSVVQSAAGVGLHIPQRQSDCTGLRPSWFPFQVNVCDAERDPADPGLTGRQMTTDSAAW